MSIFMQKLMRRSNEREHKANDVTIDADASESRKFDESV
jgi:hypothetical protein